MGTGTVWFPRHYLQSNEGAKGRLDGAAIKAARPLGHVAVAIPPPSLFLHLRGRGVGCYSLPSYASIRSNNSDRGGS